MLPAAIVDVSDRRSERIGFGCFVRRRSGKMDGSWIAGQKATLDCSCNDEQQHLSHEISTSRKRRVPTTPPQNASSLPVPDFPRTMAFLSFSFLINHAGQGFDYQKGVVADDAPVGGDERRGVHHISNKVHRGQKAKREEEASD